MKIIGVDVKNKAIYYGERYRGGRYIDDSKVVAHQIAPNKIHVFSVALRTDPDTVGLVRRRAEADMNSIEIWQK